MSVFCFNVCFIKIACRQRSYCNVLHELFPSLFCTLFTHTVAHINLLLRLYYHILHIWNRCIAIICIQQSQGISSLVLRWLSKFMRYIQCIYSCGLCTSSAVDDCMAATYMPLHLEINVHNVHIIQSLL